MLREDVDNDMKQLHAMIACTLRHAIVVKMTLITLLQLIRLDVNNTTNHFESIGVDAFGING
jgi:hypothetical protein